MVGLRTSWIHLFALTMVLAVMAAGAHVLANTSPALAEQARQADVERAMVPAPAAQDGLPVPALAGGIVLAFAVGLGAGQLRRRRRTLGPRPSRAERRAAAHTRPVPAAPPPPEPPAPPEPVELEPPAAEPAPAPPPPEPRAAEPREVVPPPAPVQPPPPPPRAEPTRPPLRAVEPRRRRAPEPPPARAVDPPPPAVERPAARAAEPPPPRAPEPRPRRAPEPFDLFEDFELFETPAGDAPGPAPEIPEPRGDAADAVDWPLGEAPLAPAEEARPAIPARRFARPVEWPEGAEALWTCEIDWKSGYRKSCFRAMVAAPGAAKRRPLAESPPARWALMTEPEPPTPAFLALARALMGALEQAGWERIGPGGHWYAQRFLWRGDGEPGPITVPEPADTAER